jgi:hypothetical protein
MRGRNGGQAGLRGPDMGEILWSVSRVHPEARSGGRMFRSAPSLFESMCMTVGHDADGVRSFRHCTSDTGDHDPAKR